MFVTVNKIDLAVTGKDESLLSLSEESTSCLCCVHVWWSEVSPKVDDDVRGPVPNADLDDLVNNSNVSVGNDSEVGCGT